MSKFKKLICLLITTLLLFTFSVCVSASNKTSDSNIKIEVVTDKAEYKATSVAKITATITNASDKDIENVTAQVVFGDLSPAGKKNSQIKKTVDTLEAGESFSFTYKATLDKDEHDLNIFQKIILFFVRLFNGGYTANNNSIDVVAENVTEIDFGKYTAENVIQVGYGTIDTEVDNKENNKLSDDDLLQINEVDVSIDNLMESDEYKNLSDDKFKAQAIIKLLTDLEKDGLIQKDSIHYYEELNQVGYYYICGVSGGVYLDSFNNLIGGISIISKSDSEESTYSVRRTNLNEADDIPNIILTYGWDDSTSTGSLYQKWDNCVKEMSERGSIATIYDSPSVFDYKTMFSDMDFICIGEHGAFDAETNTYCFAVNGENASIQADIAYNTDLYFERVLKRETNDGTMYFITPEFFSYYYNSKLNDTIVFISSCSGFGANGAIDYKFAKAFHDDCGANAVIGFHNDVWLNYALDIINEFSSSLLNGYTVTEALNIATLKHGDNHNIWIKANEDLNNYASDIGMTVGQYIETNPAAIPIMYGEPNAKLDIQTSTITGIVTNSETNSPIQYVSVQVIDNESDSLIPVARATTNAKGEYQIPNLPYGNYSISFTHDDYEYYGTALVVSQASCVKNAVLTPAGERAKITGTVTDGATTEPIPYVTIQFINSENVPVWTTITNENGTFEAKVPYDTYTVTYTHSDYEPSQDTIVIDKEEVVIKKAFVPKIIVFAGGDGTEENPYQVATPNQLDSIRYFLDKHFIQIADIDMSEWGNWEPIGDFSGSYNGDCFKISNLRIERNYSEKLQDKDYIGLFGYSSGNFFNVNIEKAEINVKSTSSESSSYCYIGGLVAYLKGSCIVKNCTIDCNIGSEISSYIGGVIGDLEGSVYEDKPTNIQGCSFYGQINAVDYDIGGIVGNLRNYCNLSYSNNYAKIIGKRVGGICGNASTSQVKIEECKNFGDINGYYSSAGIVASNRSSILNCVNYGKILSNTFGRNTSDSGSALSGGIVANNIGGGIMNCDNFGSIYANAGSVTNNEDEMDLTCSSFVGGIVGNTSGGSICKCMNYGKISADIILSCPESTGTSYPNVIFGAIAGGILGVLEDNSVNISECGNLCDTVTSNIIIQGICGNINSLYNCSGGIIGAVDGAGAQIDNCFNTATCNNLTENANSESMIVNNYCGGLIGYGYSWGYSIITCKSSYSCGNIYSSNVDNEVYIGSLFGCLIGRNTKPYIEYCYYLNDRGLPCDNLTYDGCTSLTLTDFMNEDSYIGFDFDNIWTMQGNTEYLLPELQNKAVDNSFYIPSDLIN